jgi:hypothetical protein
LGLPISPSWQHAPFNWNQDVKTSFANQAATISTLLSETTDWLSVQRCLRNSNRSVLARS